MLNICINKFRCNENVSSWFYRKQEIFLNGILSGFDKKWVYYEFEWIMLKDMYIYIYESFEMNKKMQFLQIVIHLKFVLKFWLLVKTI